VLKEVANLQARGCARECPNNLEADDRSRERQPGDLRGFAVLKDWMLAVRSGSFPIGPSLESLRVAMPRKELPAA
jgi:hypothetical protein